MTLRYKKKPAFATTPGGICSITVISLWWLWVAVSVVNYFLFANVNDSTVVVLNKHHRESPGYEINTNNVNILHNLQTADADINNAAK